MVRSNALGSETYQSIGYIQDRILAAILPHWNVIFLPLDVNGVSQDQDKADADEMASVVGDEDEIGRRFLENLAFILHQMEI